MAIKSIVWLIGALMSFCLMFVRALDGKIVVFSNSDFSIS
jgi:hypothetical protein